MSAVSAKPGKAGDVQVKLAVVQMRAFDVDRGREALKHAVSRINQAAGAKPDLMILPECAYPGYVLGGREAQGTSPAELEEALGRFREAARRHSCYIAVGMPERDKERLYNSGFLIAPDGTVAGKVRKAFLWHFDAQWFDAGEDAAVVDTPFGRLGLLICADARLPEIPRMLRLKGAKMIVDMTNWVSTGSDPAHLSNPQYEFMVPARAIENRVWFAASNKVGLERGCVLYCGRSCVVNPSGERVAGASPCDEQTLFVEVNLDEADDTVVTRGLDALGGRRPDTYGPIGDPVRPLPVGERLKPLFLACLQAPASPPVPGLAETLGMLRADLAIIPAVNAWGPSAADLEDFAAQSGVYLACAEPQTSGPHGRCALLFTPEGRTERYRKVHGSDTGAALGGDAYPVFDTPNGRLGFLLDEEGFLFEPARILALKGAELIIWISDRPRGHALDMARTRAAENGIFLACCAPPWDDPEPACFVVGPQGAVLSGGLPGALQVITAQLIPGVTRLKQIVPGTDAFQGRNPSRYGPILE